jgi:CubicO group peptidase (beta-lactamase class C family)
MPGAMLITPHPPTPRLRRTGRRAGPTLSPPAFVLTDFGEGRGNKGRGAFFVVGILLLFTRSLALTETPETYVYETPPDLDDGLKVASVETVGLNKHSIEDLTEHLLKGEWGYFRALSIIKDGYLVYDEYFHGADRKHSSRIYSVSKPFTSTLVGIAMDRGYLKGTDEPVLDYFPEYRELIGDENKKQITIHHLLTLTSGFDWDETTYSYEDQRNVHVQMERTHDWIKFILQQPLSDAPGTRWVYNTGNTQLLSAIIKKTTGLYLHEFAQKYLFGPMQIENWYWNTDPMGYTCAGGSDGGLRLKVRDMAKLGLLYAQGGMWSGRRIVSENWTRKATKKQCSIKDIQGYGYLWHVTEHKHDGEVYRCFYHTGSGGDILLILPDLDLVIVLNSSSKNVTPLIQSIVEMVVEPQSKEVRN